jgi:hypothetical protein
MEIIIDKDCVFTYSTDFSVHMWRHTKGRYSGTPEYQGSIKFYDETMMCEFKEMIELCLEKVGE